MLSNMHQHRLQGPLRLPATCRSGSRHREAARRGRWLPLTPIQRVGCLLGLSHCLQLGCQLLRLHDKHLQQLLHLTGQAQLPPGRRRVPECEAHAEGAEGQMLQPGLQHVGLCRRPLWHCSPRGWLAEMPTPWAFHRVWQQSPGGAYSHPSSPVSWLHTHRLLSRWGGFPGRWWAGAAKSAAHLPP